MPRYEVLQDYRSGAHGPWEKGSRVELDTEDAAWVNRDSAGTLKQIPPLGAQPAAEEPPPPVEPKAEPKPKAEQSAASTADEGAPVATQPRGRGRSGSAKGRG